METTALESSVQQMSVIASQSKGWLKFLGVLSIIGGVLSALTIIGILVAWLPIWMGVLLFQAGSQIDQLQMSKDPNKLVVMMNKLRLYFVIQGVLALIAIGGTALAFMIGGSALFSLLRGMR
ncbi:MAG: DUF5362 domain-containing protein [candidate division KSB1 bacterium]|nr:DUF5362 domain-containing protein [candidate division KSB1 bacterium]MDZ7303515.1 DUF5362 domain-containing protein [candidate division KSB1 bacterium]